MNKMSMFRVFTGLLVLLPMLTGFQSQAVPSKSVRQASSEKTGKYIESGVFVGGRDSGPLTLTNVRYSWRPDLMFERIVFDVERADSKIPAERPGFFHGSVQKSPRRLVLEFQNVDRSKVTEYQVSQLLTRSRFFSKAVFFYDKVSQSLAVELPMKNRAQVEIFELVDSGKPGRVVLDAKAP